jgi:large subunit ribosomal protein L21
MENYAVIRINNKQYRVEPNRSYTIDKVVATEGSKLSPEVLLTVIDGKLSVGTPIVKDANVEIEVIAQEKGEKVTSRIFKAKSRYRRNRGFRKQVTTFKVLQIK